MVYFTFMKLISSVLCSALLITVQNFDTLIPQKAQRTCRLIQMNVVFFGLDHAPVILWAGLKNSLVTMKP